MSGPSFNLPPLINIIEASSKAPKISPNCAKLDDIFLSWNKSSLDGGYKNCSSAKASPILRQSRSFEARYDSSSSSSNYLRSSSPYSYNDNIFSLPVRKNSIKFMSSLTSPYSPPSSPAYSPTKSLTHSSKGQNGKKSRMNFSKNTTKILKNWLYANIGHPFPSDVQKAELSMVTGLSIEQINNWFINGRRRLLIVKKINNITKYYKV